jgi:hypothetical protein
MIDGSESFLAPTKLTLGTLRAVGRRLWRLVARQIRLPTLGEMIGLRAALGTSAGRSLDG